MTKMINLNKLLASVLLAFVVFPVFSQQQVEINDQVWMPFISSFNGYETEKFMSLHSKDLVRSPRDARSVQNWSEYHANMKKWDMDAVAHGSTRTLELRFTERIANEQQAVEVGVYKTTSTDSNGVSKSFFGRFHVVLRKESGVWKILVDTDSSEKGSIDESDFNAAVAMK